MPNQLIHFLAPARIKRYRSFLKVSAHEEIYRAYCWNYAVSASVFPLLGYPKSLDEGLKNLRACLEDCMTISCWIDATALDALKRSVWYRQFRELSTRDCFNSWVRVGLPESVERATWRCAEYASKVGLNTP